MEETDLNIYNDFIISLYNQSRTIEYISEQLYKKCNTKVKAQNRFSGGVWTVFVPKYTKAQCNGHVYKVIYEYIRSNK